MIESPKAAQQFATIGNICDFVADLVSPKIWGHSASAIWDLVTIETEHAARNGARAALVEYYRVDAND